jgi:hypothetical protein
LQEVRASTGAFEDGQITSTGAILATYSPSDAFGQYEAKISAL